MHSAGINWIVNVHLLKQQRCPAVDDASAAAEEAESLHMDFKPTQAPYYEDVVTRNDGLLTNSKNVWLGYKFQAPEAQQHPW